MSTDDPTGSPVREATATAWVRKHNTDRITGPQTQLLFNLALPTDALNRATLVGPPGPIVIERRSSQRELQDTGVKCSSSLCLSVLSDEQLQTAVWLAKKDLRRKRQGSSNSLLHLTEVRTPSPESNKNDNHQNGLSSEGEQRKESPERKSKSSTQMSGSSPQKHLPTSSTEQRHSPPTRDPGLKMESSESQLSREICKLQKELEPFVQRIEQLMNKGRMVEIIDPDEKRRIEIRQQEQAVRSARIIYVLKQQVKEIQEDLGKLRSQSGRSTSKCRVANRLAAAHRGAVRAMQAFIQQLSDPADCRIPVQYKELGQLIRQLSLCSAKLEVGQGLSIPETTLDILQKLEMLDLALSKQDSQQKQEPRKQSVSSIKERTSRVIGRSKSLNYYPWVQTTKATQRPNKLSAPKTNRRAAGRQIKGAQFLHQDHKEVLKSGIQNLLRMREMREKERHSRPEIDVPKSSSGLAHPDKCKLCVHVRDAGFQQPTVSSKLRESQLLQKEPSVPWIPTSPHSGKQRPVSSRPEPRCLFSPVKPSKPIGGQAESQSQGNTSTENVRYDDQQQVLRVKTGSPTHSTDGVEETTSERLLPLLNCVQTVVSTDVEAIAGGAGQMVDREYDPLLQDPMLDNMLLRMEEIEKDEEEVRRRFATISYSDPLLWDMDIGIQRQHTRSRPASPQPIRLTKPAKRRPTTGDIVLQAPVETGLGSESSMLDEEPPSAIPCCVSTEQAMKKGTLCINVPSSIQKTIQQYRKEYDSYLRLISHAAVGSFNPCDVAESLAEELIAEALADVAGEFQDVCEEYAEAIFTSEFLKPLQSSSSSVSQHCDQ